MTTLNRQYGLRLPAALLDRLTELALAGDRNLSDEVRRALRLHVERERKRSRQTPKRQTLRNEEFVARRGRDRP